MFTHMQLTDIQIREFIEITRRVFKRTLNPKEAEFMANRFLECIDLLSHPTQPQSTRDTTTH